MLKLGSTDLPTPLALGRSIPFHIPDPEGKLVSGTVTIDGEARPLTESEIGRLTRWRVSTFWVMLLGYVGYYLCRKNFSVVMPLLTEELGFSNTDFAGVIFLYGLFYALGQFLEAGQDDHGEHHGSGDEEKA